MNSPSPVALRAPLLEEFPRAVELQHPRVAVSVGDVELAGRRHRHVGRPVELVGLVARPPLLAQRQQQLALGVELHHQMVADVGDPDVALGVDPQPVCGLDVVVAPRAEELAVAVEDEDRLLAAVGDVDPVLRVGRHGRHRAEFDLRRAAAASPRPARYSGNFSARHASDRPPETDAKDETVSTDIIIRLRGMVHSRC